MPRIGAFIEGSEWAHDNAIKGGQTAQAERIERERATSAQRIKPIDAIELELTAHRATTRLVNQALEQRRTAKRDAAKLRAMYADIIYANSEPNL